MVPFHSSVSFPLILLFLFTALSITAAEKTFRDTPPASSRSNPAATGPLRIHPTNPRYFTDGTKLPDGSLKAVYLTGSHTWNSLHDNPHPAPAFNYKSYLDFLERHHHNFFRLWLRLGTGGGPPTPISTVYQRTGPGNAIDGAPKYDLTRFNDEFFSRLRWRVKAAGDRGIYVAVMFFGGDNVIDVRYNPNWPLHPYHSKNNVNEINGDPNGDGQGLECYRLAVNEITSLQENFIKKVVETLGDLDNVLWEVGNELPATLEFQQHIVRFVKQLESRRPKQHPIGISTFAGAEPPMTAFIKSDADWITSDTASGDYENDPPAADGTKIIISDTDHIWGVGGDELWVWKSFTRGLHPIYMDPMANNSQHEKPRRAMGHTRTIAERLNLALITPRPSLSSTRYCLANPGKEYFIFQPKPREPFSVQLKKGNYRSEWFDLQSAKLTRTSPLEVKADGAIAFTPETKTESLLLLTRLNESPTD
jgi:hypothetical protein